MSGFFQRWDTSDGCCTCIQNKGSMMHAANSACKICRLYLRNRKSGEFELQILLKHPKFSPFWDKTNVHHNINLDKSSRKTSKPPSIRWRNTVLKQGNVTARMPFGVHHSLLPCLKVEPMSKHQQTKKSITFPSQTPLYSWQTKSGKPVDMVCLCKYPMNILWIDYNVVSILQGFAGFCRARYSRN